MCQCYQEDVNLTNILRGAIKFVNCIESWSLQNMVGCAKKLAENYKTGFFRKNLFQKKVSNMFVELQDKRTIFSLLKSLQSFYSFYMVMILYRY